MRGPTREGSHSSAQILTRASQYQVTWKPIIGSTQEGCHFIAQNKVWQSFFNIKFLEGAWDERTHTREAFQMLDVWQELLRFRPPFKDSWEDPHRRNAIPILQVYEDILSSRQLEETWEDPHRSLSNVQSVAIQELLEIRPRQETWVKSHCKESI